MATANQNDNDLNTNKQIVNDTNSAIPDNEQLQQKQEYDELLSNGKDASDPSAQRNVGAGGYTQRADQKDQLENLTIGGGEGVPQGGNDHSDAAPANTGPGFGVEGSYEMGNGVRTQDQEFGDDAPSGPAKPAHD
ncbi:hypothetical protein [Hymenobacter actinosclerus]|uniref:Uncharacterized protein n=1 Tax=Hymenobacter actinosclerus TaxID=82805 RepID=A0A1I0DBA8_9BACT|nr:hypothetical protein [Hymenobacter actinosclerus]SET29516.1 hypothetical protein SAMN04487998_1334 [Hymenobacter actinosclerus]